MVKWVWLDFRLILSPPLKNPAYDDCVCMHISVIYAFKLASLVRSVLFFCRMSCAPSVSRCVHDCKGGGDRCSWTSNVCKGSKAITECGE